MVVLAEWRQDENIIIVDASNQKHQGVVPEGQPACTHPHIDCWIQTGTQEGQPEVPADRLAYLHLE